MHKWFCSYLTNRSQCTNINNCVSNSSIIPYGVPQGSVLGPLVFLIYINDIGLFEKDNISPKLFADDTNVFVCGNDVNELTLRCQSVIDQISSWILANRLTLNVDKTFYMIFTPGLTHDLSPDLTLNIFLNNVPIVRVKSSKFLGVIIDDKLEWKLHIQDLCLRLRRYISIFYKLSLKLPPRILKMLYFLLIYPHILYGIEIYANTYASYLHDLLILNNRLLRVLQRSNFHTHTLDLYIKYDTLSIDKLFKFQILTHAHNIFYKAPNLPSIFCNNTLTNQDVHNHFTRSNSDFHRLSATSTYSSKLSSQLIAKYWNSLPTTIKSTSSLPIFKKLLKSFLQSSVS